MCDWTGLKQIQSRFPKPFLNNFIHPLLKVLEFRQQFNDQRIHGLSEKNKQRRLLADEVFCL